MNLILLFDISAVHEKELHHQHSLSYKYVFHFFLEMINIKLINE